MGTLNKCLGGDGYLLSFTINTKWELQPSLTLSSLGTTLDLIVFAKLSFTLLVPQYSG